MITIRLKDGVELAGAQPEILRAIQSVAEVLAGFKEELTITAIKEGGHGRKSLHRFGLAFDFRTRTLSPNALGPIASECRHRLGPDYDVIMESDHGHVEYDPKI